MKKAFVIIAFSLVTFSCSRNSITGRNELALLPEAELRSMSLTQYQQFLSQNKVVSASGSRDAEMVQRVGKRLVTAINKYYSKQGLSKELDGYQWEYNLVDSKEVNAWCMPGGKIVVYSGLLPVTQNEAALAVVMGHEITHALAHHGNERMSQQMIAQGIGIVGGVLTSGNSQVSSIFNNIYGPGAEIGVLLPNSRKQEFEADHYGLNFTALAGYNPQEAIALWQRMKQLSDAGGQSTPVFLRTHPTDDQRIQKLQELMPDALKLYKPMQK